MTLGEKQRKFTKMLAELILWAYDNGYEITIGDAYRDERVFGKPGERKGYGHPNSCHKIRLACDLNLFKDGNFLPRTEDHKESERSGNHWAACGVVDFRTATTTHWNTKDKSEAIWYGL